MSADVTIVVATYNRPQMLEVELHSILASAATVKRRVTTRILVVDDHSRDFAAREVCQRLGVDYLRLPANGGVARTLAAGFAQVESPYYSFWGDDDYMLPRWFELHLGAMRHGVDVVSSSYWKTDANLKPTNAITLRPVTFDDLLTGRVSANDGSLVRREVAEKIGFRPDRERAMMMTFWLAIAAAGASFRTIAEPTWLYRRHPGNLSRILTRHDRALRAAALADYV